MKYFIKDMPILKNKKKYMPGDEFPFTNKDKDLLPLLRVEKDKKTNTVTKPKDDKEKVATPQPSINPNAKESKT